MGRNNRFYLLKSLLTAVNYRFSFRRVREFEQADWLLQRL